MCKTNSLPFWLLSLVILISVMSALLPASDVDSDGFFDSLITEGLLLFPLLSSVIERSARQDRISSVRDAIPRFVARRFLHPPIFA